MSDLAAWIAANMVLDAVAPLANEARDAATRASPETRAYAQRLATCLDAERDRLVATVRRLASCPASRHPSAPQARNRPAGHSPQAQRGPPNRMGS